MNQDFENIEKVENELQDDWLKQNLTLIKLDPPKDFTEKVIEQIEIKPNPIGNSPIFWLLALIPVAIFAWFLLYYLNGLNGEISSNLNFIPNVSKIISFYQLSKYIIMIVLGGLFFIGIDLFISKKLHHRESFFSFLMV